MAAYEWKAASRIKADAQAAGRLFEELAQTESGLTAETLLEANKPESAPLHDDYEWDDQQAAHEWRLQQSRHFIGSLLIVSEETDESRQEPVRAFQIADERPKYESILQIMQNPQKRYSLLDAALTELDAFRKKYEQLKELRGVFEAADEVSRKAEEETK